MLCEWHSWYAVRDGVLCTLACWHAGTPACVWCTVSNGAGSARAQGRLVAMDRSARRLRGLAEMGRAQGLPDGFLDVRAGDLRTPGPGPTSATDPTTSDSRAYDRGDPRPACATLSSLLMLSIAVMRPCVL